MAPRPLLLVASLALGCAEPEIRGPDAAATADVAALDLPTPGDAPDAELFVDASPLDAPSVDAPVVDAPSVDAPSVDAPVVDVPPLEDFSLGPYPSALAILLPSLRSNARAYDSSRTFGHSAAQGYVLQAIARTLQAARGRALPGGEAVRDELVALAIGEADELVRGSSRVRGGAPGYGLDEPWDAFGDGSTNPAFTNYAWQTGMVATGLGELLLYLRDAGARHAAREADAQRLTRFLGELVRPWATRSTTVPGASPAAAWYWYSFEPADAKNTHNTSALISTATWMLGSLVGDAALQARARAGSEALRIRLRTGPRGYVWNYVDDGYPTSLRDAEDISHALLTTQFMRFARDRAWFTDGHMAAVAGTFLGQVWSGNPARLHGRVDGSSGGDAEWTWTRAAAIGMAAHGDAPGGLPELYDYARSVAVSSRLTRFAVPRAGGTVDSVGANLLATLLLHRPMDFAPDSRWSRLAGPGDDAPPSGVTGGVRFYHVDWAAPAVLARGDGLDLVARASTVANANVLVDLPPGPVGRVAVSITYRATSAGRVEQWDGRAFRLRALLPATEHEDGVVRWMRTTWVLDPSAAFDYQPSAPGVNVLFQFTSRVAVHRVEATPLSR